MNVSAVPASHLTIPSDRLPAADEAVVERVDRAYRAAIDGRRAARELAGWCKQFGLSEPEFQVLWCLRAVAGDGFDQATVASELVLSPALVSATVERLRAQGWIDQRHAPGDRRRHLWQLTAEGRALLERMLADAKEFRISDCPPRRVNSLRINSANPPVESLRVERQSEEEAA